MKTTIRWIFSIGLSFLLISACTSQAPASNDAGDFVIFDKAQVISFSFEKAGLKKQGVVAEIPDEMYPRWEYVEETKDSAYGVTMENQEPGHTYLYRYNKSDHSIKTIDSGDAYAMAFDGTYLYRTEIFTDRAIFYKYDSELKELVKKEFPTPDALELTNDMSVIDDRLYVLVGSVNKETSVHTNRLWILDKDFNLLEQRDIDYTTENRGGYLWMTNHARTLYIAEPLRGRRDDGEPGPGYNIVTYNLDTQELGQIQTDNPYPQDIFYDKDRNMLVVSHYALYVEDAKWTFIDLDDKSQRTISLSKGYDQYAYFTQHDGDYYFLFKDKLVRYNYDSEEKTEYDLTEFGIEEASIIVFNE